MIDDLIATTGCRLDCLRARKKKKKKKKKSNEPLTRRFYG